MKKNGFLQGALIATLAIFITKFIGIIYVIPFYKIIGTQGGALYGYAYNIYNLFLIISSAGIPLAISKLTSEYNALKQYKEKEYLYKTARKIILLFSLTCFLLCFIFSEFIASVILGSVTGGNTIEDISFVIKCVSFAILLVPLLSISRGYLQGHGYMAPPAISQVLEQIIRVAVVLGGSFLVLKVFNLSLKNAVGVSVFAASIGALCAYIYLINKLNKVPKDDTSKDKDLSKDEKNNITKKLIYYAIPFIIINIANSLYSSVDMVLLIRGLDMLNFSGPDIETISSIFTTWGTKLNTIITSFATGIALSLIPSIASSKALNKHKEVNNKFNKTLQLFFYIVLPLSLFMSIFSLEIWNIFYGESVYGPIIFKYAIIVAALDALYIMISNALQGLNKTKLIYISVITGLLLNAILDIPLILLFSKLGIYPYYGAITATVIGYTVSVIIPLVTLKRKYNLEYSSTIKLLPKLFISYVVLILLCLIFKYLIIGITSRLLLVLLILLIGLILLVVYYYLNKKEINVIIKSEKLKKGDKK